ncbi:MAG: metallophosphoesterase [Pseudomonadota bacterium]|nr:metallophosphoesterase [Pseudomonadota bacterium]
MMSTEEPCARILHLSDLHFGLQFQTDKWQALKDKARELKPDLVVVTGDLVNTPWFWMLSKAGAGLRELYAHLNPAISTATAAAPPCEVWVIPGNHDTRISGLLPVQWLWPLALGAFVLAALCFAALYATPPLPPWASRGIEYFGILLGIIGVISVGLRSVVRIDLERAWGKEHFLKAARRARRVPIGIVPFDSASEGVSWARGRIPKARVAGFRAELDASTGVTWIAAVHHHPLPLPYDHRTERMMAMDNAGALLSELAAAGIRLVLHGHKHHQHFARIVIDPGHSQYAEVAVLSAGTPTASSDPGAFWHGFNLITVHPDQRVRIRMFEAPPGGGTFREREPLDLAPEEEQDRRRHLADRERLKIGCERMLCIADIDAYGDARFYREFREVRTEHHAIDQLPGPYTAGTSSGFIETYRALSMSSWGPLVDLKILKGRTLSRVPAAIRFGTAGLQREMAPINFLLEFYANNAFALNRWQYEHMYAGREAQERNEVVYFNVPTDIAVREVTIHVRFPDEVPLPTRFDVRQKSDEGDETHARALPAQNVMRIDSQRIVQVRVPYPRLGSVLEIRWEPQENKYPRDGTPEEIDIRRAVDLRKHFGRLQSDQVPDMLVSLLEELELAARDELGIGEEQQQRAYDVAIFVFDPKEKRLRYLVGSYDDETDPRRNARYSFGLGLPGRAFKSGAVAAFRRPAYSPTERPWGYVFPDGRPVTDPAEVPEAVILAIPAAPPNARDWPYAVVQISTDHAGVQLKTANTPSDNSVERFCAAVRGLTEDFEALF